jgi:hypothetical protein
MPGFEAGTVMTAAQAVPGGPPPPVPPVIDPPEPPVVLAPLPPVPPVSSSSAGSESSLMQPTSDPNARSARAPNQSREFSVNVFFMSASVSIPA